MLDFLIITIIILLITQWYQSKPFFWKDAGIPFDATPLPLFGSMLGAIYSPIRDHFGKLYKKIGDGPMYGFHFFSQPSLVLRDANLVKIVTTTETDKFVDRGLHTESYDPMSKGLFFARGKEWKIFRGKMTPYFTPSRIKGMIPYVKPIAENFTKHLGNLGKYGPVNVHSGSMKYAVDVVMSTVFGLQPDSFDNPDSFFFGLQRELVSFLFGIKLLLGNLSPFIYGLLGMTILSKPTTTKIKQFVNDVIDQRVRGVGNRPDFVQGMVELMQKEESMNNSEMKQISSSAAVAKFDRFCITGQCMLMYLAGTETTGNSLSLVLYELAMNPEIQQTAREEIQSMIKRTNNDYDFDDLHNLHFVNMVLKETQRKYPVLVLFARQCTKTFELDGIQIPKGAMVFIPALSLHHDPEYFPEPEKFIPERFSDESNIIPGSYVPFGMGPRFCIDIMLDFLIITIIIILVTRWYQLKPFFWRDAGIPYDATPLPVFGSMLGAIYTPIRDYTNNLYKKIGDGHMYGFHLFHQPSLLLRDANLVKIVTINEADKFLDRGLHTAFYDPMSKGLFFARGEEWKVFRSKMTPYFTPSRIKGMIPYVKPIAENFTKHLGDLGKYGPANVHSASMKYAVDVVMSTVFGLQPDSFDNPNSFFFGLQRELISFVFSIKMLIGSLSPFIYELLGMTVFSKPTTIKIKQFVNDVIDQRVRGVGNRPDFVQGMVDLMQKEESMNNPGIKQISTSPAVAKFDRFCITGQCMLMYAAGTETTGNSLSLVLYELALNPEIQQTAREEIQSMIKRTNNEYDFEDLHNLHFLNMVLKETLRKYPVLVLFSRKCTKTFELDGIQIPRGTTAVISAMSLHHDPKYFPEPDKFIPERFSDESNIIPGSYVPFGMGTRFCIGMKFAQTEMVLSLCKLLPKYKLSVSSKTESPIKFSFNPTLSPAADGIWLNIKEI